MKFNVIFISMAIGLLSQSVASAPVDNSSNNDVADNDTVEVTPYHINVPGADIDIDENGVQVEKKPQDDDNKPNDDNDPTALAATSVDDDTDPSTNENEDEASTASDDYSTLDKRSPLLGDMATLSVTSDGIDAPDAGLHLGNTNNDLADDDMVPMGDTVLNKRRIGGGLAATRDGVDVAPLGLHLGRDSDDPNMATASDSAQLEDVTDLLAKRDESNDDDGDDLKKQAFTASSSTDKDQMTKREKDSQGPPPPGLSDEDLDDFNTKKKRDRVAYSAHDHQEARYGNVPGGYPSRYISEDLADAMT